MDSAHRYDRRSILRSLVQGSAIAAFSGGDCCFRAFGRPQSLKPSATDFQRKLRGAVLSIPTPFTAKLEVDYGAVRKMIQRGQPYGIRIVSLTGGNSMYDFLNYDEIRQLTRVVTETASEQGLIIAATGKWEVEKALDYARFAMSVGADALQVLRPVSDDEDKVVKYYEQIARGTELPIVLHGNFSHRLLERLITLETVVAMKEDVGLEYYIQVQRKFGERLIIFEGGPEYAFLVARPYGARASYTTLGTFVPELTQRFWQAIDRDDMKEAYKIVKKYEHPFFDRFSQPFWHASLEHFGVATRFLRPPMQAFTDEQMRDLATFFKSLGLS
jgi:dihydrodipicolinate synthase/N-acetylneuraminate lyase